MKLKKGWEGRIPVVEKLLGYCIYLSEKLVEIKIFKKSSEGKDQKNGLPWQAGVTMKTSLKDRFFENSLLSQ